MPRSRLAVLGAALLLALLAACGTQRPLTDGPLPADQADALTRVVALAGERVTLSDQVAAAKYGTGAPVTDPPREVAVLADARADAARAGTDAEWVARVFGDQIAASTQVQNDLARLWTDQPGTRPSQRPDLAAVRPQLDRIGDGLVAALATAAPARAHEECPARLAQAAVATAKPLDDLHKAALGRALTSVCDGRAG